MILGASTLRIYPYNNDTEYGFKKLILENSFKNWDVQTDIVKLLYKYCSTWENAKYYTVQASNSDVVTIIIYFSKFRHSDNQTLKLRLEIKLNISKTLYLQAQT